ncbi:MAG TPA: cyclic peptide export ABC transporter, partial [Thermoanaerobaculia bacterium]|nr:cyclic peptide export ABC transporter [Thermoanaerobaculia bacterium]
LLSPMARFVSDFLLVRLAQSSVFELRMRLARQILQTPLRHQESLGSHRLMVTITEDITAIAGALAEAPAILINGTIVLGCLIYMGWLAPGLLLVTLVLMALGVGGARIAIMLGTNRFREAREQQDQLFDHFKGMTEGAKELKLHARRRDAFMGSLEGTAWVVRRLLGGARLLFSVAANWGTMLFFVIIGLLIFVLPRYQELSTALLTGFALVLLFVRGPLQILMSLLPHLSHASVSLAKVEKLGLSLKPEPVRALPAAAGPAAWESLELRGLCHSYERESGEESFTLGPIDVTLRRGDLVFLIGGNGSGKTTFAKLFTGLYVADSGEIRLNGALVTDENRELYRQHFSAIFAEFYLFESLLGLDNPELDTQAKFYLKQLHLDHKVKVENGALSTTELSRGQRKRLALLTAYLEDRPVCVFDEWAADQDPHFKEIFYHRLLPELKARGKAVLVISHDDRYFGVADRILKLDEGKLIDESEIHRPAAAKLA